MHAELPDEEIALLRSLPILVVAAAASADREDGQGSTGEVLAGIRGIAAGPETYPDNRLVAAAFEAYKAGGGGEAELLALLQDPPPGQRDAALQQCREAAARFAGRSDDWPALTRWLRDLAAEVTGASAAGGLPGISSLLGLGGELVTPVESEFLADLALALGVVGE